MEAKKITKEEEEEEDQDQEEEEEEEGKQVLRSLFPQMSRLLQGGILDGII